MIIYLDLFLTFFKIGLFTIGGGYAMLPLIQSEVAAHGWMGETEIVNFIAVSESTPGAFAVNCATYVGSVKGGIPGAICATLGVVLPSFIIILLIVSLFKKFRENKYVQGALTGIKPAVIGLIASAAFTVFTSLFFPSGYALSQLATTGFWFSAAVLALSLVLSFKKVHPIIVILISAGMGVAAGYAGLLPGV